MIDLEVYTKQKPKLTENFLTEWGIMRIQSEIYRWSAPEEEVAQPRAFITIEAELSKSKWSCFLGEDDEGIDAILAEAREAGFTVPEAYARRLKRTESIYADRRTYKFLEDYPDLERAFPDFEPVWGLLRFNQGNSLYSVHLETPIWVAERPIMHMVDLAVVIADRFDGIIWNPQNDQFGKPNAAELFRVSDIANEGITGLLEKYLDVYPVQK